MSPDDFAERFPILYHMTELGKLPYILERGLLSTSALLDLFQVSAVDRCAIESVRRLTSKPIHHPIYGTAVIRDQKPMSEKVLRSCLVGMEPREWYELLNSKVFFWPTINRLETFLGARDYRDKAHVVISVKTSVLLE